MVENLLQRYKKTSFRNHCRCAADEDVTVRIDAGGDDRRPSHCLTLDEGALCIVSKTATLLEVICQRGVGSACCRLLRYVVQWREVADMSSVAVAPYESRRLIAQLSSDFQHQFLFRERVRVEQHHSGWISAERLVGESVNDEVVHKSIFCKYF